MSAQALLDWIGKRIRVADQDNQDGCGIDGLLVHSWDRQSYSITHVYGRHDTLEFDDSDLSSSCRFGEDWGETIRVQLGWTKTDWRTFD